MAVNFVARKCACGGKLEFDPQKKVWICKYCGTVIEREATFDKVQVDGIEGINDVVRQALMDIANNKMDSASRNLEDCERKNHKHIGTLIANISYNLSMISCVRTQDEARGHLEKVKVYAKRLQTEFPSISVDEINMYEAFGESVADIYANLLVVFDTLNDESRIEYLAGKLHTEEIFSEYANKNLLKIALKRKNYAIAEAVVNNTSHIDKKYSLQEVLMNYPDQDKKMDLLGKLFSAQIIESIGKDFFENYFAIAEDSIETKTFVLSKVMATNLKCNAEGIVKALHRQMDDYGRAKEVFLALYGKKINDQETEEILEFCLTSNKSNYVIQAFLDALSEKNVYVQISSGNVIAFLDNASYGLEEKRNVIKRMFEFEIDAKSKDAVYNYYLNNNNDDKDTRLAVMCIFLTEKCPISSNTIKNYFVKTSIDEENKIKVIEMIFATGINKTYLGDLLSEYLLFACDEKTVKDKVTEYLINSGFKIDSNILTRYIVTSSDEIDVKIENVKKLINNGTQVRADCLESYIMSVGKVNDFSEVLFDILSNNTITMSVNAYAKYLMECKDIDKTRHNGVLLSSVSSDLNKSFIKFNHLNNVINGNVLQAYVLNTNDHYDVAKAIVAEMLSFRVKLNSDINVGGNTTKFKKYVADNKSQLSPLALQICEENRMFSLF